MHTINTVTLQDALQREREQAIQTHSQRRTMLRAARRPSRLQVARTALVRRWHRTWQPLPVEQPAGRAESSPLRPQPLQTIIHQAPKALNLAGTCPAAGEG